jgi:hypothetical protein
MSKLDELAEKYTEQISQDFGLDPIRWTDFVFNLIKGVLAFIFNRTNQ